MEITPDLVNAVFQTGGAALAWKNVLILKKHQRVVGVYWPATLFFALWGIWNLFYFPMLGQWLSFITGCVLTLGNLTWSIMAIYLVKFRKSQM